MFTSYTEFMTVSLADFTASLPAIDFDWWMDFSMTIVMRGVDVTISGELPIDFALMLACKVTYVAGLGFLLLENAMQAIEYMLLGVVMRNSTSSPLPPPIKV